MRLRTVSFDPRKRMLLDFTVENFLWANLWQPPLQLSPATGEMQEGVRTTLEHCLVAAMPPWGVRGE